MIESDNVRPDLPSIAGDELSSVCFVRDYIELHFDGPVLRLLGDVSVTNADELRQSGDPDFRNWLCRNIGRRVAGFGPLDSNEIEIKFHGNDVIRVEGRSMGIEFAQFISYPDMATRVWEVD